MPEIKISVKNKIATAEHGAKFVCRNSDYTIKFDFDEEWSGHNFKTALFVFKGKVIPKPFDGNICKIPIIKNTTLVGIGVKTSDESLKTAKHAFIPCELTAEDIAEEEIEEPTPSVYDEIISLLNKYLTGGGSGEPIDFRDYQKKVDENLQTTNKTIVGAINEVKGLAETAKMVFGETEGTAYEGNKGKANADNIAKLKNELAIVNVALEQSGLVKKYKQPIEQEYTERVTADGANVLDGSKAVLKKVVGTTVRYDADENGLNGKLENASFAGIESTGRNLTNGITQDTPLGGYYRRLYVNLPKGKYTLAFDRGIFIQWNGTSIAPKRGVEYVTQVLDFDVIDENEAEQWFNFRADPNGTPFDYSTKIWIYRGYYTDIGMPPYEPYISSTLAFPKTEMPLGKTIDFENKKIIEGSIEIVLNGTENWVLNTQANTSGWGNVYQLGIEPNYAIKTEKPISNFFTPVLWGPFANLTNCIATYKAFLLIKTDGIQTVDEFKTYLAELYANGNPVIVRYLLDTPTETPFTAEQSASGNEYTAYKGGTEKVLDNDSNEYGADNTLTQDYILVTAVE